MKYIKEALLLNVFFIVPFTIGFLIISVVSETNINDFALLKTYYLYFNKHLTWVNNYSELSAFPIKAAVYLTICWTMLPVQIIGLFRYSSKNMSNDRFVRNIKAETAPKLRITKSLGIPFKYWFSLFFIFVINPMLITHFYLAKDPWFCSGCVNHSLIGMFIMWSFLTPVLIAYVLFVQCKIFKNFREIFVS